MSKKSDEAIKRVAKEMPRPMTKKELDARRRLLQKQAQEIVKKYPS